MAINPLINLFKIKKIKTIEDIITILKTFDMGFHKEYVESQGDELKQFIQPKKIYYQQIMFSTGIEFISNNITTNDIILKTRVDVFITEEQLYKINNYIRNCQHLIISKFSLSSF